MPIFPPPPPPPREFPKVKIESGRTESKSGTPFVDLLSLYKYRPKDEDINIALWGKAQGH